MAKRQGKLWKLLHADAGRKTRFHTLSGQLVLSPDMLSALGTTMGRRLFGHYTSLPWLTYPAVRFLDKRLRERRLFEFGSGTSTKWFGERCSEVYSVENNRAWFAKIGARLNSISNVRLKFAESDTEVVAEIASTGKTFDAIVIDCQPVDKSGPYLGSDDFRVACLRAAIACASDDCLFIVDNTDAMAELSREVGRLFAGRQVRRFPGWAPGIFHPNETTIVM